MAKLIGTCGHVDHGKTTLIRALTGIDADRFPEEKLRGMTIDIGFAYIDLPTHGRVSIVDVPGHERFLSNMLVGAMGVDVGLLCIAADAGVMPQTREHLAILDLLPVTGIVVALTRADLAEPEWLDIVKHEVTELLKETRFQGATIVSVSATSGDGLPELREALDVALAAPQPRRDGPWYLPIDRAFTVKGHGTVVTGTLMQGTVKEGAPAVLMPSNTSTRIRSVQSHDEHIQEREFGSRTALNLGGVDLEDVHRGMAVGEPGALFATRCLDLTIRWVAEPKHGQRIRLSIGADEVMGKLFLNDSQPDLAQVRLERETAAAAGQPVILRRYSPPDLIGGGKVAVPEAVPRRRSAAVLSIGEGDDRTRVIQVAASHPNGVTSETICRVLGRTNQQIGGIFETLKEEGTLLGFAGTWITPEHFDRCIAKLQEGLLSCHAEQPNRSGVARERAVAKAGLPWSGKPLDRIIAHLATEGRLRMAGTEIAHPDFVVRLNARQEELLARVEAELERHGFSVPTPRELGPTLGIPSQAVDQILEVGVHASRLIRLTPEIFYTTGQMQRLRGEAKSFSRPFTAGEFRDHISASRKYVIPILERWDAERFTTRQGDARVVNE